ncbi:DNA polymerase III subunit gamma and tau [Corynebacterium halotolerans]|uniref:DNA polymerase III subunit gamma and tau n=1 Tax=Corynebacterium halotolerans TaxID=225326 RepID=UPI003CE8EDB0
MALYRKYRPASFAEVVGQEQVTRPLSVALDSGRINHAYLFSGPRGCGKTSSARILARSLNCVEGPTSTPCGVCNSCVSLAPGGPGNLDVTELDAASHNGVEDMRELRDKAHYAPAESRYRVFIIDEAHMISPQGFNAMLKIVEEPPEHLIFIFATTEPEKVIGTIRSRTHHYPFRLLTPGDMRGLLQRTAAAEDVQIDDAVYPLVIEAGGGSPRDSLSILDQLVAGSGPGGVNYEDALGLLGVTDLKLIDAAIDALAANDSAALFRVVDDVIEAGHEPRRFVTDLLSRLRDLMVLQSVPEAIDMGLVSAPTARAQILQDEAAKFSGAQLASLAAQVNDRVSDMRGATAPRLLLEILCAHLLLPSAAAPAPGGGVVPAAPANTPAAQATSAANANQEVPQKPVYERPSQRRAREAAEQVSEKAAEQTATQQPQQPKPEPVPEAPRQVQQAPSNVPQQSQQPAPQQQPGRQETPGSTPDPVRQQSPQSRPQQPEESREPTRAFAEVPAQPPAAPQPGEASEAGGVDTDAVLAQIRSNWAKLRGEVGRRNKIAEIMLTEARILGIREDTLVLGHNTGALAERLNEKSKNDVIVAVLKDEMGLNLQVNCVVGTNPETVGFPPPGPRQSTWNPTAAPSQNAPAPGQRQSHPGASSRESADSGEESASPAPAAEPRHHQTPPQRPDTAATGDWGAPAPLGGNSNQQPAASEGGAWGNPAPLSGTPAGQTRASVAPPAPPQEPERPRRWEQAAARGNAKMQERAQRPEFSGGVPLPPEPDDPDDPYGYPPDEGIPDRSVPVRAPQQAPQQQRQAPQPSPAVVPPPTPDGQLSQVAAPTPPAAPVNPEDARNAEEEEMVAASLEPGQLDRRDAQAIAMELLANELGARPL